MRRLTGLLSVVSITVAVAVFFLFPRGGEGMLGQFQLRATQAVTGFSQRMSIGQVMRVGNDPSEVGRVFVWRDGQPVKTGELLIRGVTHDTYGETSRRSSTTEWSRSMQRQEQLSLSDGVNTLLPHIARTGEPVLHQKFMLRPLTGGTLFSLAGPTAVQSPKYLMLSYGVEDESLRAAETIRSPIEYEVWATGQPGRPNLSDRAVLELTGAPRSNPLILAEIEQYTRRAEIIGPQYTNRPKLARIHPSNLPIAKAIESHLKGEQFSYTMDVSDADGMTGGEDQIVSFLTKAKRGWCVHYASAMALMCQSLGIPARMVLGYKTDEYNAVGGYFIIRQLHSHAWVEVLTEDGWTTFDPTSDRFTGRNATAGWWQSVKHFFDYLEFKWGEHVINYDQKSRADVLGRIDRNMTNAAIGASDFFARIRQWLSLGWLSPRQWAIFSDILGLLVLAMVVLLLAAIALYLYQRYQLWRRVERIGLEGLSSSQKLQLARQLAFYDQLTRLLERHKVVRARHLTSREFAESLSFLPAEAFQIIRRLTRVLYRVRFGEARMNSHRQRRLLSVVHELSRMLDETVRI